MTLEKVFAKLSWKRLSDQKRSEAMGFGKGPGRHALEKAWQQCSRHWVASKKDLYVSGVPTYTCTSIMQPIAIQALLALAQTFGKPNNGSPIAVLADMKREAAASHKQYTHAQLHNYLLFSMLWPMAARPLYYSGQLHTTTAAAKMNAHWIQGRCGTITLVHKQ